MKGPFWTLLMCISMLIALSLLLPRSSARMSRLICVIPNNSSGLINRVPCSPSASQGWQCVRDIGTQISEWLGHRKDKRAFFFHRLVSLFLPLIVLIFYFSPYTPHSKTLQSFMAAVLSLLLFSLQYSDFNPFAWLYSFSSSPSFIGENINYLHSIPNLMYLIICQLLRESVFCTIYWKLVINKIE